MADRTEFEIALKDAVTPELRQIAQSMRELINLAQQLNQVGGGMDKFGESTTRTAERIKNTNRELGTFNSTLLAFTRGILAPLGTIEGVRRLAASFLDLAESRVKLGMFADTARISAVEVVRFTRGMENLGVSSEQAQQYLGNLTTALKDIGARRYASQIYNAIAIMPGGGRTFAEQLRKDMDAGDMKAAMDRVLEVYRDAGPNAQFYLSQIFGIPESVFRRMLEEKDKIKATLTMDPAEAKKIMDGWNALKHEFEDYWEALMMSARQATIGLSEEMKKQGELLKRGEVGSLLLGTPEERKAQQDSTLKRIQEHEAAGKSRMPGVFDWLFGKQSMGAGAINFLSNLNPVGSAKADEFIETGKDSNRTLKDILDVLRGGTGGAGGGIQGSIGVRSEGGPMQATGGGFRRGIGGGRGAGAGGEAGPVPGIDDGAGAGMGGSEYLKARRARMAEELNADPELKKRVMAVMSLEHESDPIPVAESLLNRTDLTKSTVRQRLTGAFYGPMRVPGLVEGRMRQLERDPKRSQRLENALNAALEGSNLIKGATDQGSGRDPNVNWPGGRIVRGGEVYNDWGGGPGHEAARRFREEQQRRVREGASGQPAIRPPTFDERFRGTEERATIDKQSRRGSGPFEMGTASIDVDFKNVPRGVSTSAEADGVFKTLKVNRTPQAGKSGGIVSDYNRFAYE